MMSSRPFPQLVGPMGAEMDVAAVAAAVVAPAALSPMVGAPATQGKLRLGLFVVLSGFA